MLFGNHDSAPSDDMPIPFLDEECDEDMTVEKLCFDRLPEYAFRLAYVLVRGSGQRVRFIDYIPATPGYLNPLEAAFHRHYINAWISAYCRAFGLPDEASLSEIETGIRGKRVRVHARRRTVPTGNSYIYTELFVPQPLAEETPNAG